MRLKRTFGWLAMLASFALAGAGCGGINANQSVSPASFLLPGLMRNDAPAATNAPVAAAAPAAEFVLAK